MLLLTGFMLRVLARFQESLPQHDIDIDLY